MAEKTVVKKGSELWCTLSRLKEPKKGVVVVLTDNPTKRIGLEFKEDVGGHDCDGAGKSGHCLWCRAEHVKTDEQMKVKMAEMLVDKERADARHGEEVEEVEI